MRLFLFTPMCCVAQGVREAPGNDEWVNKGKPEMKRLTMTLVSAALGLVIAFGSSNSSAQGTTPAPAKGRTFAVSPVPGATKALPTETQKAAIERLLAGPVESCSAPNKKVVKQAGYHATIAAVNAAFEEEYPLALSPDSIWDLVAQGFARHVRLNAEAYRKSFVDFSGQKTLIVQRDNFVLGNANNDWVNVFPDFSKQIRAYIGETAHKSLLAEFSTTSATEKAASEIVLMETVGAYFKYEVWTRCGIPQITLLGTTEDWEKVAQKAKDLRKFGGLDWWFDEVDPVLAQFVEASKGKVDLKFWQSIYKVNSGSGTPTINGHLLKLLPYVMDRKTKEVNVKNPVLTGGRIVHEVLPQGLSSVPFIWDYYGTRYDYQFIGGPCAFEQDPTTFEIRPVMGWAVRPAPKVKTDGDNSNDTSKNSDK